MQKENHIYCKRIGKKGRSIFKFSNELLKKIRKGDEGDSFFILYICVLLICFKITCSSIAIMIF